MVKKKSNFYLLVCFLSFLKLKHLLCWKWKKKGPILYSIYGKCLTFLNVQWCWTIFNVTFAYITLIKGFGDSYGHIQRCGDFLWHTGGDKKAKCVRLSPSGPHQFTAVSGHVWKFKNQQVSSYCKSQYTDFTYNTWNVLLLAKEIFRDCRSYILI